MDLGAGKLKGARRSLNTKGRWNEAAASIGGGPNRKGQLMKKTLLALSMLFLLQTSAQALDKIRIGYPDFNSSTFTLPLAQLRGFFQEEGLQAELIRIRSAVALPALTSGEIDYHTVVSPAIAAAMPTVSV